ncbi:MAG: TIGR00266 family protein [bacterium]
MHHQISHEPAFSMLRVDLDPGDIFVSEAGAMAAKSTHVQMDAKLTVRPNAGFVTTLGAMFAAFIRKALGGESFFVTHYTTNAPGTVWITPTMSGSIVHRRLEPGQRLTLSAGAYVASSGDIDVIVKYAGLRGILAKEGAFFLEILGNGGDIWFNSYGGVDAIDVNGTYIVDNGHIVGWEGALTFDIKSAGGGLIGMVASGEGMVCEFKGQGRVYIQSRNFGSLIDWLSPLLPG